MLAVDPTFEEMCTYANESYFADLVGRHGDDETRNMLESIAMAH